jgi:hypothetical protein
LSYLNTRPNFLNVQVPRPCEFPVDLIGPYHRLNMVSSPCPYSEIASVLIRYSTYNFTPCSKA